MLDNQRHKRTRLAWRMALVLLVAPLPSVLYSCFSGCSAGTRSLQLSRFFTALPTEDRLIGDIVPVHDPSLTRIPNGTYIVIDTDIDFLHGTRFLEQRCSLNLVEWRSCGYIFDAMPAWVRAKFPGAIGLWAPDISYFHGLYHVYYCVSALGSQHSAIGLVTNVTLDSNNPQYHWTDQGEILASDRGSDFNAIDPNVLVEHGANKAESHIWLNYGSFWNGIFQEELNPSSGKLLPGAKRYHLAQQPSARNGAIEGASIIEHQGWYYLFASVGICCDLPIERDTYQQIVGRSVSLHGPFLDEDGGRLLNGGGSILLTGDTNWIGPGGGSAWRSADQSDTLFAFHALHRRENGALDLWVARVNWKGGWPSFTFTL